MRKEKPKQKWNGCTPFYKGMIGTRTGQKASPETREKLRLSHLGKPGYWKGKKRETPWMFGEKNHNWKGGNSYQRWFEENPLKRRAYSIRRKKRMITPIRLWIKVCPISDSLDFL